MQDKIKETYSKVDLINIKISAAIQRYDELCDDDVVYWYFVGKFRKDYRRFFDFFYLHTKDAVKELHEKNPLLWQIYAVEFNSLIETKVTGGTKEVLDICIMVSLLRSALKDLRSLGKDFFEFSEPLRGLLGKITDGKHMRGLPISKTALDEIQGHVERVYN